MAHSLRKLIIAVVAVLAFFAGNFAMVSSGMAHTVGANEQHVAIAACATDHGGHHALEAAGNHPCEPVQKGTCDAGPTCCSSACQALVLAGGFLSFRAKIDIPEEWVAAPEPLNPIILLERPPRRLASA